MKNPSVRQDSALDADALIYPVVILLIGIVLRREAMFWGMRLYFHCSLRQLWEVLARCHPDHSSHVETAIEDIGIVQF
jgi:hypothetical protein